MTLSAAIATLDDDPLPAQTPTEVDSLLGSLRRRLWLVLLVTLAGTAAALWVGLRSIPTYTAHALLLLAPSQPEVASLQITVSKPESEAQLETAAQVIRSRRQIERIIDELSLLDDPEFHPRPEAAGGIGALSLELPGLLRPLLRRLPVGWPGRDGDDFADATSLPDRLEAAEDEGGKPASATMDVAVERFGRRFSVFQQGMARVLDIGFWSTDPVKAARIANRAAELYIEAQIEERRAAADRATDWLAERVSILAAELERSEAAAQRYRAEHGLVDQRKTDITDQQLAEANRELIQAQADLAARTVRLDFMRGLRRRGEPLDTLPEVLGSPVIIELRRQEAELSRHEADVLQSLGPRHPEVARVANEKQELAQKVDREVGRIVANLENEAQVVKERTGVLVARLTEVTNRGSADERAELRLKALEREAAANRQLYEQFLARYKEIREQRGLVAPVAEVISVAAPPTGPSSLGPKALVALGFMASATLGGLLAVCLEHFDRGLRSEADVRAALGLRRLALVPTVPRRPWLPRPHAYCVQRPLAAYSEALRAILVGLRLAAARVGDDAGKVVLVTSALPGEGKTTLAVSLAVYASHVGRRVLLVDLDLRHPRVARTFGHRDGLGAVEVLAGDCALEDAIVSDPKAKIDYLGAGGSVGDPLPLLAAVELERLLARLRRDYDHIIIDTAPVLTATDSLLLTARVDKVLFAVQWGVTPGETARSAVSLLRAAGADIAGAVLTQVNMRKHVRYNFGDVGRNYRQHRRYYLRSR